jgi:MFS family permease
MKAIEVPQTQARLVTATQLIPKATLIYLAILLLGETTINYIDRQVVSVLAPTLRDEFHMSNSQYAAILNAFLITYLFFYSFAGWALDKLGFRRGLSIFFTWWSTAGALTSLSTGPFSLAAFRSLIAVGEAGAWPSFAKAAATWVPAEAQALFIGACNSGSSLGAMITLPLVAGIVYYTGSWRAAFAITAVRGCSGLSCFKYSCGVTRNLWMQEIRPPLPDRRKPGSSCFPFVRHGPFSFADFSPIPCGTSFCSGYRSF